MEPLLFSALAVVPLGDEDSSPSQFSGQGTSGVFRYGEAGVAPKNFVDGGMLVAPVRYAADPGTGYNVDREPVEFAVQHPKQTTTSDCRDPGVECIRLIAHRCDLLRVAIQFHQFHQLLNLISRHALNDPNQGECIDGRREPCVSLCISTEPRRSPSESVHAGGAW